MSWTLRRKPLESFLAPQAAVPLDGGGGALVCRDGSLVSLIRLDGARSMTGAEELERFVTLASRKLNTAFVAPGHALHVAFDRAPDEAREMADAHAEACRRQGVRLGLDLDDLLAERARRLAPLMAVETLVLACWTRPGLLPKDRLARESKALRSRLRDWLPAAGEAQCPYLAPEGLWPRHEALLDTLEAVLAEAGIVAARLPEDDALRAIRRMTNGAASTAPDWRPVTVANDAPPRFSEPPEAGAFPPPLAPQLLVREPERLRGGIRIGERLYGALDMCLGPRHARPFSELMAGLAAAGLRPEGLPCRFSLLIEGGGLHRLDAAVARVASSILAFSSPDSLHVRNALRDLAALDADAHAVVRLRLGLLTWVAQDEGEAALAARLGRLQQVAEGWGEAAFTPLTGDALESFVSSIPGFCCGATAEPALAPLTEALRLFPASRPAPLGPASGTFVPGTIEPGTGHLFRSPDGKPLPLSADEGGDYGFELIYGLPGQGKSVLMNALGLAFALQEGRARLPLSAVIDIGPSSSGLVSLVREALPPERRHEAGWFALRMTDKHAINPCDTQLGCRSPLPAERAFLTNLLSLMVTPAGDAGAPDGMRELIGPAIAGAYALRSDRVPGGEPHAYTEGRDADVDAAIAAAGLRLPERPLWWDVVDLLFEAGAPEAAARAQRYAVPTLVDLLASAREPAVQGLVGEARYGTGGETVTQAFIRMLTALSGDWPVMFAPTAFDVGGARLAAIDLAEVAPQGSAEADRQSAAFYLLARHALTRHWWIGEDALASIPEPYREWHAARLRDIRESPKRLCYDEFHRTAGAPAVRAQVERDVREARKLRV
ncbi:MAG: hypothetical protein OXN81_07845, partial [Alphaproteobacteria bacterium]|nr:hypothetical protein [Alphaproteobacteria bacterium]